MTRLAAYLATRPGLAAMVLLGLLLLALPGWLGDAPQSPWTDDPQWEEAAETEAAFGILDRFGWIALFGTPDTTTAGLEAIAAVEASVESLPWVADVLTPLDLPGPPFPNAKAVQEHPLVGPMLASPGGFLLPFEYPEYDPMTVENPPMEWVSVVRSQAQQALEQSGLASTWEAGVTGVAPVIQAQSSAFRRERKLFTGLGTALVFLIATAAFRNARAVLLAGSGPLVGVAVAIGLSRLIGLGAEGFTGVVLPLLVLTIGFTDSLHLVVAAASAHRVARGSKTPGQATVEAVRELAWPCFLTSITTAIGFGSLALASNPVVVQFGLSCALGTLLTFVCVLLVIPCLAHTPLGIGLVNVRPRTFRPPGIDWTLNRALARPRGTAVLAFLLTAGLLAIALQLRVDKRVSDDLSRGSEAALTLARTDVELGGAFPLHVRIDWEDGVPLETMLSASRGAAQVLAEEEGITAGAGPAQLAQALVPGYGRDQSALAQAAFALAAIPREWSRPFLQIDKRTALVHARQQDVGTATLLPAFERIRTRLRALEQPGLKLGLVGNHIAHLATTAGVAGELGFSLALAALLILITLGLAFRSLPIALASVVPNVLPVAAACTGLLFLGNGADLSSLTALTLALGIAADDTIHVLARWRTARLGAATPIEAARQAVHRTLPALAMTTLTLIAAFGILLTSSIPIIGSFGMLVAVTLAAAFFADVWLLPALLVAFCGTDGTVQANQD